MSSSTPRTEDYWEAEAWSDVEVDRRTFRLSTEFYGALCAHAHGDDTPKNHPSLATCERSSTPGASAASAADAPVSVSGSDAPGPAADLFDQLTEPEAAALPIVFRLGVDDVDRAVRLVRGGGDRLTALYEVMGRDEERIQKVLALLERDEVGHAVRLATCGRRSVQLECPPIAGGCGFEENYVPISCGSRLCPDCTNDNMGRLIEKWKPAVAGMDYPTFGTFTIQNVKDPAKGRDAVVGAFGRLRQRTIPFEGETVREGATKRWCWWRDGGRPSERWKVRLQEAGAHELVRHLEDRYVRHEWEDVTGRHRGRNIPFKELVKGGLYAVDVKQKGPEEFNVHLHVVMDSPYIPQAALSSVWEDLTGDPVVDVRRIYDQTGDGIEDALAETVAYAVKSPEFETVEDSVEFATEMKGKALVHPFGSLHGAASDTGGMLHCAECGNTPSWWNYQGFVDHAIDNMGKGWETDRGKDPPADAS